MTDVNREVDRYLADLERALAPLPSATAADIREGISEELHGLSGAAAKERMLQLGDPKRIAAEARSQLELEPSVAPSRASAAYVVVTAVAIGLGGALLVGAGWVIGVVMLWLSPIWARWEKWLAIGVPLGSGLLAAAVTAMIAVPEATGPSVAVVAGATTGLVVALAANLAVGGWLLITGLRRGTM